MWSNTWTEWTEEEKKICCNWICWHWRSTNWNIFFHSFGSRSVVWWIIFLISLRLQSIDAIHFIFLSFRVFSPHFKHRPFLFFMVVVVSHQWDNCLSLTCVLLHANQKLITATFVRRFYLIFYFSANLSILLFIEWSTNMANFILGKLQRFHLNAIYF